MKTIKIATTDNEYIEVDKSTVEWTATYIQFIHEIPENKYLVKIPLSQIRKVIELIA